MRWSPQLVTTWHPTQPLQCYWLYWLCCTAHPCDCFVTINLYFVPSPFTSSPATVPSPPTPAIANLFSVSIFCFACLFLWSLASVYKWDHTVHIFLWLTYFTQCDTLQVHACHCKWKQVNVGLGIKPDVERKQDCDFFFPLSPRVVGRQGWLLFREVR